jgi:hypothetical protein
MKQNMCSGGGTMGNPYGLDYDKQARVAWVRTLAQSKRSPVTIRFHGVNDKGIWLWSITNELGETLALQGDQDSIEFQMAQQ